MRDLDLKRMFAGRAPNDCCADKLISCLTSASNGAFLISTAAILLGDLQCFAGLINQHLFEFAVGPDDRVQDKHKPGFSGTFNRWRTVQKS